MMFRRCRRLAEVDTSIAPQEIRFDFRCHRSTALELFTDVLATYSRPTDIEPGEFERLLKTYLFKAN